MGGKRILALVVCIAAAAAVVAALLRALQKKQVADSTVAGIEEQLAALDPATRAAVEARLTANAVKRVKAKVDSAE
jgi:hypothetical protein